MKSPWTLWTLDEALALVRLWQPSAHVAGWHLALAGGVLNHGISTHDLDIVVMKFRGVDGAAAHPVADVLQKFQALLPGLSDPIDRATRPVDGPQPPSASSDAEHPIWQASYDDKAIEFFIYGN